MLTFRSPPELTARIEAFADHIEKPRSEAIRQLVEKGLDGEVTTIPSPSDKS